jgi:hypothetical protein
MLSRISYCVCALLILYASFGFYPKWNHRNTEATLSFDVSGYYWYLPAFFIYHDARHQAFKDSVLEKYHPTYAVQQVYLDSVSGNYIMKYSSGMAVMYLPFFTAAHLLAGALGYPADGFSTPYQLAIQIGGIFMALLGLWFFRKFLKLYYSDGVVAIVLLILVFGTNYLNYAAIDTGMSHNWLFTTYVFLLLSTHYYYQLPRLKYAIAIGLLTGLATLTRPTEIISCLIPILWGLNSISSHVIKERLNFFKAHMVQLCVAALCAVAVICIQLIYWKYASGHWLVYSYQDQGFSWLRPHFYNYTVSFRSGWLTYTPMMVLAFIGIIPLLRTGSNKVAIVAFFLLNYYIVCAWDIWWYGGRAMIQGYPVLMLPIAALVAVVVRKRALQIVLVPLLLLFCFLNIWYTYAAHRDGIYVPDRMNKSYYKAVAGRFTVKEDNWKLLDNEDALFKGTPQNKKLLYTNNFEQDTASYSTLPPIAGQRSLCLTKDHKYSPYYMFAYSPGQAKWMRAEAAFRMPNPTWDVWDMAQFNVKYFNRGKEIKVQMIRVDRFLSNQGIRQLFIDIKTPADPFDSVGILFYNGGKDKTLQADNLNVWGFDE